MVSKKRRLPAVADRGPSQVVIVSGCCTKGILRSAAIFTWEPFPPNRDGGRSVEDDGTGAGALPDLSRGAPVLNHAHTVGYNFLGGRLSRWRRVGTDPDSEILGSERGPRSL